METIAFEVREVEASVLWMNTRIPFRYGIATLTELPHLFLRVRIRPEGASEDVFGISAEGLLPKWFDKNPETSGQEDLQNMWASIAYAVSGTLEERGFGTAFEMWHALYQRQEPWGTERKFPALLWHFGVTMVERAVIDALCRYSGAPLSELLAANALGIQASQITPDVSEAALTGVLRAKPLRRISVRHTVGMGDPLTADDLEEAIGDGLPETLEDDIRAYGLTFFKIKVRGDVEPDIDRLSRIAALFTGLGLNDFAFSLDGNEQFHDAETFRDFFAAVKADARLSDFFRRLLFVEQPFARKIALTEELGRGLSAWSDRPPIIIDESDGSTGDALRALQLGYSGTSYKNCKGVFKGLLNAARIQERRDGQRGDAGPAVILSGEDLANVGPVALLQDLAMMAKLGISHVERNGHHYFRGLSRFSADLQDQMLQYHGDLYHSIDPAGEGSYPTLHIRGGAVSVASVVEAPFGVVPMPEETEYQPFLAMECPRIDS